MVVAGEDDVIRPAHSQAIADHLPNGELKNIPQAGHVILAQKPTEFISLAKDFL